MGNVLLLVVFTALFGALVSLATRTGRNLTAAVKEDNVSSPVLLQLLSSLVSHLSHILSIPPRVPLPPPPPPPNHEIKITGCYGRIQYNSPNFGSLREVERNLAFIVHTYPVAPGQEDLHDRSDVVIQSECLKKVLSGCIDFIGGTLNPRVTVILNLMLIQLDYRT
jgi:hypothetical protein